jgi:hypothetical protein
MPFPTTRRDSRSRTYTRPRLPSLQPGICRHAVTKVIRWETLLLPERVAPGRLRPGRTTRAACEPLDASGFPHLIVDKSHNPVGKTSAFACPTAFPYIQLSPGAGRSRGSACLYGQTATAVPPPMNTFARFGQTPGSQTIHPARCANPVSRGVWTSQPADLPRDNNLAPDAFTEGTRANERPCPFD